MSLRRGSQAVVSLTHGFPRLAAQSPKKSGLGTQEAEPRRRLSGRAGPAEHYRLALGGTVDRFRVCLYYCRSIILVSRASFPVCCF
jgi:hypothetical protein